MNIIEKFAALRNELTAKLGANIVNAAISSVPGHNLTLQTDALEKLAGRVNSTPAAQQTEPATATPSAANPISETQASAVADLVKNLTAENAGLKAKLTEFDGIKAQLTQARADLTNASTQLAAANAKIADFDRTVEDKASMKAQTILAACGGVPIVMSGKDNPASLQSDRQLTGMARIQAATRKQIEQQLAAE